MNKLDLGIYRVIWVNYIFSICGENLYYLSDQMKGEGGKLINFDSHSNISNDFFRLGTLEPKRIFTDAFFWKIESAQKFVSKKIFIIDIPRFPI